MYSFKYCQGILLNLLVEINFGLHFTLAVRSNCDETNENYCENGGTCVSIDDGDYECICLNGYVGKNCSQNTNDCLENLCAAGSTCIDGMSKYTCVCPPGKMEKIYCTVRIKHWSLLFISGLFCHLDDPCIDQPCRSGAECVADTANGDFSCNCMKGTKGQDCATDINECEESDNLCFNGGICVNTFGSWYCDCPLGYSDPYCMTHSSKCEPNPCLNGASCLDYASYYECICQDGYYGKNCEKNCPTGVKGRVCKQHRISLNNNYLEELFEEQICTLQNCSAKAGNAICDSECNYPKCHYDGYDCSAHVEPFRHCPLPRFCARVFKDNKCDPVCNSMECLWDGFDCDTKSSLCVSEEYCSIRFNDGYCDRECFSPECYYDGFDCTQQIEYNRLEGNLILTILIKPEEFSKRASVLQFTLSLSLQARVTIAVDEENQQRLYLSKIESKGSTLYGTRLYLNVDTKQCQSKEHCESKITDMEKVTNFIGALSSKKMFHRIDAPIYAAETDPKFKSKSWRKWILYILSALVSQIFMAFVLLSLHKNFKKNATKKKQRTVHVTGTWYPPTLDTYCSQNLFTPKLQINSNGISETEKNQQTENFIEISVKSLEPEAPSERRWTTLHDQAMDYFPITFPVNKSLLSIKTTEGRTAMMLTALNQMKSEEVSCSDVENLFLSGALIDEEDDYGQTALILAIKAGRAEVVKCLLRLGAHVTDVDDYNRTTLHHAASINASDILRLLLEAQEIEVYFVDAIDDSDCSPLMTIAKLGYRNPEAAALLIDAGADINCAGNHINGEKYIGRTALHYAAMQSNQELARYLVERGANLNIQDQMGQTPLFLAASQGHVEIVHLLVMAGARRCIPDNMDQTPEAIAAHKEYKEVVDYFVSLRALKNDSSSSSHQTSNSTTPEDPEKVGDF
ncbi:unnamed protein product [Thelazia callipaeda]|uniref:Notch n=1 Tax=Thelazia callipaeda TaxID=103827 RepID=A0A0N5CJT3_THECL|nr:unnamed protein product [Thelazia callipaeda]